MKNNKEKKNQTANYRLYCFTNMYLSSIQKGIQTAHIVGELTNIYGSSDNRARSSNAFLDWCNFDKTIIVLNGGNSKNINQINNDMSNLLINVDYPDTIFLEDEESLNNATTAYGIILPEKVWGGKSKDKVDKAIYKIISSYPLAV